MKKHKSKILFEKSKLKDFYVLIALYILGLIFISIVKTTYLENILIVYLPGLLYSFYHLHKSRRKVFLFGLCSLLFIVPVEILARMTDSWDVASTLPRILGIAPLENVVYALVNIIYPLAFYEVFYDGDRNRKISSRWKILIALYLTLFIVTFVTYFTNPALLNFNYWVLGAIIIVPVLGLMLIYKRHILKRLLVPAIIFGAMYFAHELISMNIGHWWWPGDYLFPIIIDGLTYPLEDFIIWIIFSNIAVISGYEVLWD